MPLAGSKTLALDFPPTVQVHEDTAINNISSTTYGEGSPECSVTFMANSVGRAAVTVQARCVGDGTFRTLVGFEVRENNVSGSVVQAAADARAAQGAHTAATTYSYRDMVSGLTPGGTYFVRTMHKVAGGSSNDVQNRALLIEPAT